MRTASDWVAAVAALVASPAVGSAGELTLAEFQADAARRLAAMVRDWGGALLADSVGLGKTRVALAVASVIARERRIAGIRGDVWCCVPSRLANIWRRAADAAGVDVEIVTHAAMSRGRIPAAAPSMVVVDEAHRFRNLGTRRRQALAQVADAPLLLLSATPVANSADDLFNLLRLFLDDDDVRRGFGWDLDTAQRLAAEGRWDPVELLSAVTVRRTEPPEGASLGRRPSARLELVSYEPSNAETWVWANIESEVRALTLVDDSFDWPRGLFIEHVLRRWESGPEALADTLADLEAFVSRRIEAARTGRRLDRASFREIFGGERSQGVFAFLLPDVEAAPPGAAMFHDLERLQALRRRVRDVCAGMFGRDTVIARLARTPEPLLVFTSYQRAAEGIYERLRAELGPTGQVGLVTGQRAEATGLGRASADELLARFAPIAHGVHLDPHQRIRVLVATDCIAEGVDLQDCGRVVLADLPYSPLGIEQRVGRLVRLGSRHDEVRVYLPRPSNWNDSLGMRRRLVDKVGAAQAVGFGPARDDPFATLTELERIATRSAAVADLPQRAVRVTPEPTQWLAVARVAGRPWLFRVGSGTVRSAIAELGWSAAALEPCSVPADVAAVVDARRELLRAASAAPSALQIDGPQVRAWRAILEGAGVGELAADRLGEIRDRLLRTHRLGVRRHLDALLTDGSAAALVAYVEALPSVPELPEVELITALGF